LNRLEISFDSGLDNEGQTPTENDEGWEELPLSTMTSLSLPRISGTKWGREDELETFHPNVVRSDISSDDAFELKPAKGKGKAVLTSDSPAKIAHKDS
jgi:hypothetical protein